MIPFQVDPSWYEKYWWREPASRRLSAFALLRRGLGRFRKIQGSNVTTHAIRLEVGGAANRVAVPAVVGITITSTFRNARPKSSCRTRLARNARS